jgi:hypothetical protein
MERSDEVVQAWLRFCDRLSEGDLASFDEPADPEGYAEGPLGWLFDQPTFAMPDGSSFKTRVTAVLRNEDGDWRIVHAHFSVAVPDEEVVELASRWGQAAS